MTPEEISDQGRWLSEMRELISSNSVSIVSLTSSIRSLTIEVNETRAIADSNARVIQSLCQLAAEDRQERAAIINEIAEMQSEVRGIQTENRRILDILLNQQQGNQE